MGLPMGGGSAEAEAGTVGKSLKSENRFALTAILVLNLLVLLFTIRTGSLFSADLSQSLQHWQEFLPAGVGVVLVGVVNGFLSSDTKARLIFWRWSHPLPGSRAFSYYAHRDSRINVKLLEEKVGPFPSTARDQNSLWYRLYRSVRDDPSVVDVHRHYLLMRDYAAMTILLLPIAGPISTWQIRSEQTVIAYIGILLLQYLAAMIAARNYGFRFVTNVLALKTSNQ